MEGVHAAEEEPAEVPVLDDERVAGARGHQQIDDRASDAGQRDGDPWQKRGGGLGVCRQDHQRDERDGEVRTGRLGRRRVTRSHQAAQQGGNGLQTRHDSGVPVGSRHCGHFGIRAGGLRRERAGPPGHHRADRRLRRSHARTGPCAWRRRSQAVPGQDSQRHACGGGSWLPVQAQCNAVCGRRRLPGGNRRGVGDGRGHARDGIRRGFPSRRERRGVRVGTSPGHDVRSGGRVCPGAVYRALRLRRGQGLDRVSDRHQ